MRRAPAPPGAAGSAAFCPHIPFPARGAACCFVLPARCFASRTPRRPAGSPPAQSAGRRRGGGVDEFMHEYALSSEEGVMLMCLAEALLRIPDAETADRLIADKIGGRAWERHLGHSDSLLVNASTWGLMLTGRVLDLGRAEGEGVGAVLKRLVARSGEPVIRQAVRQAMRIMGRQFVLGRSIAEALALARPLEERG